MGEILEASEKNAVEQRSSQIESKLMTLLNMVNEWLRYAETKNSNLLLFSGAVITAISTILASSSSLSSNWRTGLLVSMSFLCISCPVSLASFFPQTNLRKILAARKGVPCEEDNLYFFGHLCKYTAQELIQAIARSYLQNPEEFKPGKHHTDIAAQIVVNSHIATYKYKLFSVSLMIAMLSISAPIVLVVKSIFQ